MKTKLHLLFWLFALVPLAFTSCDDDETFVDETTLSTSLSSVTFTKDGGQQSVSITTSATTWVATSPLESSWLTLTQNGAQLDITAAPNTEGVDRKGYILVNAGSAAAKINVVQSAGDVVLSLSTESLSFDKAGGEQRIDVICNESFSVEADEGADWLGISYVEGADFFTVAVTESNEPREGKVFVTAGTTIKELVVKQGTETDTFILPYIGEPATYTAAFQYEINRGHALSNIPIPLFGNEYYEFSTGNADCPMLGYWYNAAAQDEVYSQASALYTNAALFTEDDGAAFQTFMEEKGFTYNAGSGQFTNPDLPFVVYYTIQDGVVQINSIYQPAQKEPQPTFSAVPATDRNELLHYAEGGIHGGTLEDVAAWEAEHGGTFAESVPESDYTSYSVADQPESLTTRGYWDDKTTPGFEGEIMATQDIYTDLSRVYYTDETTGDMYETEEFLKLMADNGYTYLGANSSGFEFYSNGEIQLGMLAFEMTPGETVIQFQAMKIGSAPSVKSILLDSKVRFDFLKKVSERFENLNDGHIRVPLR